MKREERYYIKDISDEIGVPKVTIRLWERKRKIPQSKRDPMSNYRYWTEADLKKIKKITGRG